MKINVTSLMSAIERYIAKADDNLEEKLSEEGYVNAAGVVKAINDLEDSVRDALEAEAESFWEILNEADDIESFLDDTWSTVSTSEELKEVLRKLFRKKFDEMLRQFTFEWILSDAPDYAPAIDDERITKPAEQFIKDWSQQLADIMNLTTKDSIERILLDAQEKGWSIDDTAKIISDSGIRQPGYRSRRVALTEVLRIESYAQQEAMVQNPLAYAKKWKHVLSSNPRENHMAINGQQVFKRETFTLTGADGATYRPLCPRDTSLPASESVNCHCLMEMVADESALGMSKEEWVKARSQVMDEVDAEWEKKIKNEESLKYADEETINSYYANGGIYGKINIEDLISNTEKLQNFTPHSLKIILSNSGYEVKALNRGSLKGISFEDGGGYKVNFGMDGIFQYHPEKSSHHEGAYYKISTGITGTRRYNLDGTANNN